MPEKVSQKLAEFNKWRRGKGRKYQQAGSFPMSCEELGVVIDTAVKMCKVVESINSLDLIAVEQLSSTGLASAIRYSSDSTHMKSSIRSFRRFVKAFTRLSK